MVAVSIILPSLNVSKYIEECLEHVLAQSLQEIEIICIDAGSTDGTYQILSEYAKRDTKIKVFNSEYKSYGYQVNLGLRQASGKYIGIVDTDDYIDKHMYEHLFEIAENNQADLAKGGFYHFFKYKDTYQELRQTNGNVSIDDEYRVITAQKEDDLCKMWSNIGPIWAGIYNREFLLQNDIWLNETPGASFQDTSFHMMVALNAKKAVYLKDCFYHYRTDREEASVKSNAKIACVIDEYRYIEKYMQDHGMKLENQYNYVLKNKLYTYFWNLERLDEQAQKQFMDLICKEMDEYRFNGAYISCLSDKEKTLHRYLSDWKYYNEYKKQKESYYEIIQCLVQDIKQDNQFVIVGAGNYLNKLLFLKQLLEKNFIVAICDNSKQKQGKNVEGYVIKSVEETVKYCPKHKWIVANKYYADQIKQQIQSLGIEDKQIVTIKYIPESFEMIQLLS